MKILIVPMAAMAETHGPVSRCRVLAYQDFKADYLGEVAERIIDSREFSEHAAALGKKLSEAGGMNTLVQNI